MTREVEWGRLTAPAIRDMAADASTVVMLPVGSLEQHGPHLPTLTDTVSAHATAVAAARLLDGAPPALVLPGLWTGMSEHHLPFGGMISLNFDEFRGVLRGVARSLRAVGFGRLIVVNGHGGNIDPLAVACRELAVEFGFPIVSTTPWFLAAEAVAKIMESDTGPKHACEGETSLMMAIAPEIVRTDNLDEAMRQRPEPRTLPKGVARFQSFSERAPVTGTWGDPRSATPDKGRRFLAAKAQALAAAIRDPRLWTTPDCVWAPGRGQGTTAGSAT